MATSIERAKAVATRAAEYRRQLPEDMLETYDAGNVLKVNVAAAFNLMVELANVVTDMAGARSVITIGETMVTEGDMERAAGLFTYDRIRSKVAEIIYEEHEDEGEGTGSSKPGSASLAGLTDSEWTADLILKSLTEADLSVLEDRIHDEHEDH